MHAVRWKCPARSTCRKPQIGLNHVQQLVVSEKYRSEPTAPRTARSCHSWYEAVLAIFRQLGGCRWC